MAAEDEHTYVESVRALSERFTEALQGEVVGVTDKTDWLCECGESGTAGNETMAGLALYQHRKRAHP